MLKNYRSERTKDTILSTMEKFSKICKVMKSYSLQTSDFLFQIIIRHGGMSVPQIDYWFEGARRKYFPDFYIPAENLIVEVKSTWTFANGDKLEKNLAKRNACLAAGYKFEFYIYDGKGNRVTENEAILKVRKDDLFLKV
jgi:predicted AAA+ superfamily ATPase